MPQLHVPVSNSDVEEPVEGAYAEQQHVVEMQPGNCGEAGGDFTNYSVSSAPRPQFAPAVAVSNSDVVKPVEGAYAEHQHVVDLPPGNCGEAGGDFTNPSTSSAPRPQLAPAVAQLFSSVSQTRRRSTRDDISELLDVHPQGIALNDFFRVFETCFHRPFDSRCTDVTNLRQMLERMADLIQCVELGNEVIVRKKDGLDYFRGNALHVSAIIL